MIDGARHDDFLALGRFDMSLMNGAASDVLDRAETAVCQSAGVIRFGRK